MPQLVRTVATTIAYQELANMDDRGASHASHFVHRTACSLPRTRYSPSIEGRTSE